MAARSNAWLCGRSLAGTAGSNPAEVLVVVVCCHVRVQVSATGRSFAQRSHTECVVCMSVIVKPRQGEGLGPL